MRQDRSDRGYTLIEMLVVCVAVGLLASIAVPVFLNQRSKAARSAMAADLHSVVVAQTSWSVDHATPTTDLVELQSEGYRQSRGVSTPHVVVTAASYVACVWHDLAGSWLVYDSATGAYSESASDCA